jgi:uncharacterized membrane protein HdeD (DUF308 family)
MTAYNPNTSALTLPPTWVRVLLGIVLIVAGLLVLGDVALATLVSTIMIAVLAIIAGAFEIVHAFWTKGWGGFIWQILLGILYITFGIVLWNQPVLGALVITYVLGLLLVISGVVRILLSYRYWHEAGWIMLLSGIIGVIAGAIIISRWPMSGLWVLGLLLGIDLLSHGLAWLLHAWAPASRVSAA